MYIKLGLPESHLRFYRMRIVQTQKGKDAVNNRLESTVECLVKSWYGLVGTIREAA